MEKLRVDNGLKKIEVNDRGDFIEFSVKDNKFIEGFGELVTWMEGVLRNQKQQTTEETEKTIEMILDDIKGKSEICKEACCRIDKLFGSDTCKKVFGNIEPDEYVIGEFMDQIVDFMDKFQKERQESIGSKYSNERKGANSI
ncbi:MAG: hypothetical protein IJO85_07515 [Lachnospiraceae bacterium]|nr:hypothetical protein [Lachnospiraceae bacterium]